MKSKQTLILFFILLSGYYAMANNILVSNVSFTSQNTTTKTVQVQFTVSWENSWRVTAGPGNWDAAWIFVKYRIGGGPWLHANLNTTGHFEPAGATIATGLLTPGVAFNATTNPGVGAFLYRNANGSGTFTATNAQLQWNYGANGLGDNDVVDVQVFAIEHVYVPQGSFAAGDGLTDALQFTLTTINTGTATTAPTGTGSLGGQAGGYPTGQIAPTTAGWPNGFNAFYCMKYEITQQGFVDFLNTLTRAQQANRVGAPIPSGTTTVTNRYVMSGLSGSSTLQRRNGIRCDAIIPDIAPVTFYCDLDGDGIGGESNDGKDLACNYINWWDIAPYLDWAGLRPLTELEYEKAGRGTLFPLAGEYAWGTTIISPVTSLTNAGQSTEKPNTSANANYGLLADGPIRVGSIAGPTTNREQAGASYYGIMELSGNVYERVVNIAGAQGRSYLATHGNGLLASNGFHTNADWPSSAAGGGVASRGSHSLANATPLRLSDRSTSADVTNTREATFGGRGCRTAL